MAAIILPSRWTQQPQGAVEVDWSHSITRGLVFATIFPGSRDLVGIPGTVTDSGSIGVGVGAAGMAVSATDGLRYLSSPNDAVRLNSGGVTHLGVVRIASIDSPWGGVFSVSDGSANATFGLQRVDATSNIGIWRGNEGEATMSGAVTALASNTDLTYVAISQDSAVSSSTTLYVGNTVYTGTHGGPAVQAGSGVNLNFFAERNRLTAYGSSGLYYAHYTWARALSDAEARSLTQNPWQIFRPQVRRIYFDLGASSPTLLTLSVSASGSPSFARAMQAIKSASASSAAVTQRLIDIQRGAASSATATAQKQAQMTRSASGAGSATLDKIKTVLSTLSASGAGSAALPRVVGMARSATSTGAATYSRVMSLLRAVTGTGSATLTIPSTSQFLRPDGNVTQTSFTGGFAEIDETTASDADFAYGTNNTAAVLEVGLSNPTGTPGGGTTTVRYRIAKTNAGTVDGGGNAVTVTVAVYQGTTLISADAAQTATGTWTQYSWTPSMAGVTDWNDVRLRFTTSASGGTAANRRGGAVSWAEVQAPAASSGTEKTLSASATATATIQSLRALISSLSATATGSASTSRVVSMVRSVTSSAAASVSRIVAVTKDAASTATASVVRTLNKAAITVTSSAAATLVKATATAMTLTAAATGSAVMSSVFGLVLSASAAATALYMRAISLSRAVTATGSASVTRGITKALSVVSSAIATLVKQASSAAVSALRTLAIAAENRIRGVSAENRIHPAGAEDRIHPAGAEDRNLPQ